MSVNPVAAVMLKAARSMLGEMEAPAMSNYHPTVSWYRSNVADIGTHWNYCCAGVSREFATTAAKPLFKPRAYVPWSAQDFRDGYAGGRLIWVDSASALNANARPGDVVFFDWDARKDHSLSGLDHIGVVEAVPGDGTVITIEHNTSVPGTGNEGVARKVRDAKYVAALGRPDWSRVTVVLTGGGASAPISTRTPAPYPGHQHWISGPNDHHVEQIQKAITQLGYPLTADSDFGPKTDAGVRWFQKRKGLKVDGWVGPGTWSALRIYN